MTKEQDEWVLVVADWKRGPAEGLPQYCHEVDHNHHSDVTRMPTHS